MEAWRGEVSREAEGGGGGGWGGAKRPVDSPRRRCGLSEVLDSPVADVIRPSPINLR